MTRLLLLFYHVDWRDKEKMQARKIQSLLDFILGESHKFSVEHRLFHFLTLFNGLMNFGNVFALDFANYKAIILLNFSIGVLFIILYFVSRIWGIYRVLYWPFMLSILAFLIVNIVLNAGSYGGTQYYLITGLVIGVILASKKSQIFLVFLFFGLAVGLVYYIENYTNWVVPYKSPEDRPLDVFGNLFFVQMLTAFLVVVMSRALNRERQVSDSLLHNILPDSVATELKQKDRVQPRHYELASVLFTDFVGFTQIAESLSPEELISELDRCFREFDRIMEKNRMEKIKTIGDAYMAAGGIPEPNSTNPVDAVLAALQIQDFMEKQGRAKQAEGKSWWQLRLGIHSGPLVAGVIGQKKFAYDIWGDTVNLASRMESSGVAGAVNISEDTYRHVQAFFECEYRGKVDAKNKGKVDMYLVRRIKPELAQRGNPTEPNTIFLQRLELGRHTDTIVGSL